jgi:predicted RNA binding protein YcfA (HicA-like mRNA interferase family)
MKAREIISKLKSEGWYQVKSNAGSHLHFKHQEKPGKISVPMHGSIDIAKGTLHSIFKQAGWK